MRFRKRLLTLLGVAAIAGLGVFVAPGTAQADPIDTAPQGIKVQGNPYFTMPGTLGTTGIENSAKLLEQSQTTNRLPMDGIEISKFGMSDTGGAIWSNNRSFDLYKNQRLSMWIYMSADSSYWTKPGEGMAFVLQNDSNNEFSGTGEALGVWGADPESKDGGLSTIAGKAIQNSWAVEFDTNRNITDPSTTWPPTGILGNTPNWIVGNQAPSAFDLGDGYGYANFSDNAEVSQGYAGEHIASGYPGDEGTYSDFTLSGKKKTGELPIIGTPTYTTGNYHYYKQDHHGLITDSSKLLTDGFWHHVTLDYTKPAAGSTIGTMEYYLDDKSNSTGAPVTVDNKKTKAYIDTKKLSADSTNSKVFWGITGSTGVSTDSEFPNNDSQDSLVVFEHVPGLIDSSASATVIDEATNSEVGTAGISGNSKVKVQYKVNYDSGSDTWESIMAKLRIPKGIQITSGTIQKTNDAVASNVDVSGLSGSATTGQSLNVNVGDLTAANKTATITLEGKTLNDKSYTTSDVTSNFVGTGEMTSATIKSFKITQQALMLNLDQDKINVNQGNDLDVTGKVVKADNTVLANSKATLHPTLYDAQNTGTALPAVTPSDIDTSNPAKGFTYHVAANSLPAGTYQLSIIASDGSGNYTKPQVVTIVIGNVDFGSSSGDLNYDATISGTGQLVSRSDPNWSFNINDTVTSGTKWKLYAEATPLTLQPTEVANAPETNDTGTPLDGQLVYSDGTGIQPLTADAQTPITDHVSDGSNTPVNIASDWDDNSGILLQLNGGAVQGHYQGTVTWILTNGE